MVLRHRRTIAVVFPVVGVALLVGTRLIGGTFGRLASSPALTIPANLVMCLPLAVGLWPLVSRRIAAAMLALCGFAYVVEAVAVATGVPYGRFAYTTVLRPLAFGLVPLALPLFWLPILLNGYLLAVIGRGRFRTEDAAPPQATTEGLSARIELVVVAAALATLLDAVLDPGAVALGFWAWREPGPYYGVPAVNFAGWLVVNAIGAAVLASALPRQPLRARLRTFPATMDTLIAFLVFWGLTNLALGQPIPALVALAFGAWVLRAGGRP